MKVHVNGIDLAYSDEGRGVPVVFPKTSKCATCPSALAPPAHAYSASNPPTPKTRTARATRYLIRNSIGKPRQDNPGITQAPFTCPLTRQGIAIIEHCKVSRIPRAHVALAPVSVSRKNAFIPYAAIIPHSLASSRQHHNANHLIAAAHNVP